MNAMKIGKPMNRDKTLGLLLAAACFAGGFWETTAQEITEPETLEIQYDLESSNIDHTIQVAKDIEELRVIGTGNHHPFARRFDKFALFEIQK